MASMAQGRSSRSTGGRGRGEAGQKRKAENDPLPAEYRKELSRGGFCVDLARGHCSYGDTCRFKHEGMPPRPK